MRQGNWSDCHRCKHQFMCLHNSGKVRFLGLKKDYNNPKNVILQCAPCLDSLSCELWKYIDARITTKKLLKEGRPVLLEWVNKEFDTDFTRLIVE